MKFLNYLMKKKVFLMKFFNYLNKFYD